MMRIASLVLAMVTVLGLSACNKPTPDDCRKALLNMQHLLGTENLNTTADIEGEVRRCRGGSKRAAVACAIKATTLDELRACDFYKVPGKQAARHGRAARRTGSGSAAPAGSAPAGSGSPRRAPRPLARAPSRSASPSAAPRDAGDPRSAAKAADGAGRARARRDSRAAGDARKAVALGPDGETYVARRPRLVASPARGRHRRRRDRCGARSARA